MSRDLRAFDCFRGPGNWYKGNLHTHTTLSDGRFAPEITIGLYEQAGYDFVAITDHDVAINAADYGAGRNILVIGGTEYYVTTTENYHGREVEEGFDLIGIHTSALRGEKEPQRLIDGIRQDGGLAIVCHPYWIGTMSYSLMGLRGYVGLEIYNWVCEDLAMNGSGEVHWDDLLRKGVRTWGFACDDSHSDVFFKGWIMVKSAERTVPAILAAVENGSFYATQGIQIFDVGMSADKITVTFDRPCAVLLRSDGWPYNRVIPIGEVASSAANADGTYTAELPYTGEESFIRLQLTDAKGGKAYTNPIFLR